MNLSLPTLLDALAICVIGLFALVGAARGMLRGVLRIVIFLAAVVVGQFAAPLLAPGVAKTFHCDPPTAGAVVWIAVTALVALALCVCAHRLDPWISKARLILADPVLGLFLGVAFGILFVIVGVSGIRSVAPPESKLNQGLAASTSGRATSWVESQTRPIFAKTGPQ